MANTGTGVSRFFGKTSREAMRQVRLALGAEALIISNRRVNGGVEVIAARPQHTRSQTPLEEQINRLQLQLSSQMETLLWGDSLRSHVPVFTAYQRLLALGYSTSLARELLTALPRSLDSEAAWHWVQQALLDRLPVLAETQACLSPGATIALVGPTGVGKTTTLAKLAYQCVQLHGAQRVALISTDNYRIGAHEQLKIYARLLQVPVHSVRNEAQLREVLLSYGPQTTLLIDSVGVSQRDEFVRVQARLLASSARAVQRLLVVSAASSGETLDEVARAYKTDGGRALQGCVVTKLDEANSYGPVVDMAIRYQLPIAFITDGQRVPEDLILPDDNQIRTTLMSSQHEQGPVNSLFRPTTAELATLLRHPQAADAQPEVMAASGAQDRQQAIVDLVSAEGADPTIATQQLQQLSHSLRDCPEWRFWMRLPQAPSSTCLQQLWASVIEQLPPDDQRVFFLHDHLRVPRCWHPKAQLIVSHVWTATQQWRGPLQIQQISAHQQQAFPTLQAGASEAPVEDPFLAAARNLPQSHSSTRWHYHVFSDYQQGRFMQWLGAGHEGACIVAGATRCHDGQAQTTVAACIKQQSRQPLYVHAETYHLLQRLYRGQVVELSYAQSRVGLQVRGQDKQQILLYGVAIHAARDGRLLDHFCAFSTLHARVHTHSVLQALLVFVLQRPLKRQIQYQIEAHNARSQGQSKQAMHILYGQALGGLLGWRLWHDPQLQEMQALVRTLWGDKALRPGQMPLTLRRLAHLMAVLGMD